VAQMSASGKRLPRPPWRRISASIMLHRLLDPPAWNWLARRRRLLPQSFRMSVASKRQLFRFLFPDVDAYSTQQLSAAFNTAPRADVGSARCQTLAEIKKRRSELARKSGFWYGP
jgi:hypothetical protein